MSTRYTFAALGLWLWATAASGLEGASPGWSLNGFGTLGVVHSSEGEADYVPDVSGSEGPGRSGSWDAELDSRLGLQFGLYPTSKLSAVVQLVAEQNHEGDQEVQVEWANVRYDMTPALSLRAGRVETDSFLVSQHRKVGLSIPWVRPPVELYGMVPVTSSDGVDVAYRFVAGEFQHRTQIIVGRNEDRDWKTRARAISHSMDRGPTTLRAVFGSVNVDVESLDLLFDAFAQFGPEGVAVARQYSFHRERLYIAAVGGRYDPGNWFVMGEWGWSWSDSVFGRRTAWYLSAGRRFGNLTPYVTYSNADRRHGTDVDGLTVAAYPPALAPVATGLNAALGEIRASTPVQQTLTVGARWDVARNVDVKVQYDRVDVDDGSPGTFSGMTPGYRPDGADLFSLALDFMF